MSTILDYFTAGDIRDAFGEGALSETFFKAYPPDAVIDGESRWLELTVRQYAETLGKQAAAARDLAARKDAERAAPWQPESYADRIERLYPRTFHGSGAHGGGLDEMTVTAKPYSGAEHADLWSITDVHHWISKQIGVSRFAAAIPPDRVVGGAPRWKSTTVRDFELLYFEKWYRAGYRCNVTADEVRCSRAALDARINREFSKK